MSGSGRLDAAGGRRSLATLPGFPHRRAPRNRGPGHPPNPPTSRRSPDGVLEHARPPRANMSDTAAAAAAEHREEPPLPAYIIVETDIQDHEQYERYKNASPAAVKAGGGRFLVRGGEVPVLEGR